MNQSPVQAWSCPPTQGVIFLPGVAEGVSMTVWWVPGFLTVSPAPEFLIVWPAPEILFASPEVVLVVVRHERGEELYVGTAS